MPSYTITMLGPAVPPADEDACANSVNESGHAVGYAQVNGKRRAVVWNPNQQTLVPAWGSESRAIAINASGQIVGYYDSDYLKPWFFDGNTLHDLAAEFGWWEGLAFDINDDGLIALS